MVEPKIYVIKPLQSIAETLKTQKTVNFTQLLDNDRLNKIFKTESIDTKYIMSICLEPYFKAVLDQYLQKVLVNGRTIPLNDLKKYEVIKKKVLNLFRMFFYGDQITLYERQIEKKYLAEKQKKWYRYLNRKVIIIKFLI